MDQDRCLFDNSDHCKCADTNDNLGVISYSRFKTVKVKSENMEDVLHTTKLETLPSSAVLKTQDTCISRNTWLPYWEMILN